MDEYKKFLIWKKHIKIPYCELVDSEGYSYELLLEYKKRRAIVFISESGVHIEWGDKNEWQHLNIIPRTIFKLQSRLNNDHLLYMLKVLYDYFRTGVVSENLIWKNR